MGQTYEVSEDPYSLTLPSGGPDQAPDFVNLFVAWDNVEIEEMKLVSEALELIIGMHSQSTYVVQMAVTALISRRQ